MDWPSLKPLSEVSSSVSLEENQSFGMPTTLVHGFSNVKHQLEKKHPIERVQKRSSDGMNLAVLEKVAGRHAPLRLLSERNAASQVGRLPFLPSSNLMLDVLMDHNETVTWDDVLNDPSQAENMGPPHMIVEKHLGLM